MEVTINKLKNYAIIMRLNKPIGILLLLMPTLWALWLAAGGMPPYPILIIFVAGVVLMRSAGCVINDIADRKFDGFVARTKLRPLVTKTIKLSEAILLFVILCLLAFSLVWQLNIFTIYLSGIGLVLAIIYPFMKRYINAPQLFLGFAFAWAVPMAYAAVNNYINNIAWLVFLIAIIWPIMYDTMYAMVDRDDDKKINIKSTAIWLGKYDIAAIVGLQIIIIALLILLGLLANLNFKFYFSLFFGALCFGYQIYLIKDRDPELCFKAFLNNWVFGLIIFLGIM